MIIKLVLCGFGDTRQDWTGFLIIKVINKSSKNSVIKNVKDKNILK